ncbi:MAG TPA: 30S ribosome-binding factor RbfA [Mycobacteriales bacterium]|nr:30S ribosome-binding factor RbfA [Mycobacteriales bacterium]
MTDVARARRLAVRIREIVADTLERQVKDPRLGMVTITEARVTPDLREATVFYTVYGDEATSAQSAAALESARGVLRTQVGRQTGVRFTPSLTFVADTVSQQAKRIEELIDRARHADAELHRVREGASYAGDPEPYRTPETDEADGADGADGANETGETGWTGPARGSGEASPGGTHRPPTP